jgi:hypothetical protein
VRRDWFVELGGFDTARFPRPQIEDIELGYRIRDRGGRIVLDPAIQGTHLKRWTLGAMVRTDIRDRGLPWMRLLLERRGGTRASLNIGWRERAKVGIAAVALASLVPAVLLREGWPLLLMLGLIGLLVVVSFPTYRWFAAERGGGFALAVVPLHLLYYAGSAVAAVGGVLLYALGRGRFSLRKAGP